MDPFELCKVLFHINKIILDKFDVDLALTVVTFQTRLSSTYIVSVITLQANYSNIIHIETYPEIYLII